MTALTAIWLSVPLMCAPYAKPSLAAASRQQAPLPWQLGVQIDTSKATSGGVPTSGQLAVLGPSWVRFDVRHVRCGGARPTSHGVGTSGAWANTRWLVEFDNQEYSAQTKASCAGSPATAPPPPLGSNSFREWQQYFDKTYLRDLHLFLRDNLDRPIGAIEVWNEEDIGYGLSKAPTQAGMPPKSYAYLISHAATLIKTFDQQHNLHILVVMGGLASGSPRYIADVVAADTHCLDQVDAIGLHPYAKKPGNGSLQRLTARYQVAAAPKPIWVTEVGHEDVPFGETKENPQWQASFLAATFQVFHKDGIPVAIWYGWSDAMAGHGNAGSPKIKHSLGLFDSQKWDGDENIKPAGVAFANISHVKLDTSVSVTPGPARATSAGFAARVGVTVRAISGKSIPHGTVTVNAQTIALDTHGHANLEMSLSSGTNRFEVSYGGNANFKPHEPVYATARLLCHGTDAVARSVWKARRQAAGGLGRALSGGCIAKVGARGGLELFDRGLIAGRQASGTTTAQAVYRDQEYAPRQAAIVREYEALGGLQSGLGYPTGNILRTGNGSHAAFQNGLIYDSPPGGLVTLAPHGKQQQAIVTAYASRGRNRGAGGPASSLGYPIGGFVAAGRTIVVRFVHGAIGATARTVVVCVDGKKCTSKG